MSKNRLTDNEINRLTAEMIYEDEGVQDRVLTLIREYALEKISIKELAAELDSIVIDWKGYFASDEYIRELIDGAQANDWRDLA